RTAADVADGLVDTPVIVRVLREGTAEGRTQRRCSQLWDVTDPVHRAPQIGDATRIRRCPSTEGSLSHLAPERTVGERLATAAEFSFGHSALPQVEDLPD